MQTHQDVWWSVSDQEEHAYFRAFRQPNPILDFVPWPIKVQGIEFPDGSFMHTAIEGNSQTPWQTNINGNGFTLFNAFLQGILGITMAQGASIDMNGGDIFNAANISADSLDVSGTASFGDNVKMFANLNVLGEISAGGNISTNGCFLVGPSFLQFACSDDTGQITGNPDSIWVNSNNTTFATGTNDPAVVRAIAQGNSFEFNAQFRAISYNGGTQINSGGAFAGWSARGTVNSPGFPLSGDRLVELIGWGFLGTGLGLEGFSQQGGIYLQCSEDFSTSSRGTHLRFLATPVGNTLDEEVATLDDTGMDLLGPNAQYTVNGVPVGSAIVSSAAPSTALPSGSLWFDTNSLSLNVLYAGTWAQV